MARSRHKHYNQLIDSASAWHNQYSVLARNSNFYFFSIFKFKNFEIPEVVAKAD